MWLDGLNCKTSVVDTDVFYYRFTSVVAFLSVKLKSYGFVLLKKKSLKSHLLGGNFFSGD